MPESVDGDRVSELRTDETQVVGEYGQQLMGVLSSRTNGVRGSVLDGPERDEVGSTAKTLAARQPAKPSAAPVHARA
jgi:hypothetical protein